MDFTRLVESTRLEDNWAENQKKLLDLPHFLKLLLVLLLLG